MKVGLDCYHEHETEGPPHFGDLFWCPECGKENRIVSWPGKGQDLNFPEFSFTAKERELISRPLWSWEKTPNWVKLAEFPNQGTAAVDDIPLPWGFALDYVAGAKEEDNLLLSGLNFSAAGVAMVLRKGTEAYYLVPLTPGAAREVIEWVLTPERR